MTSANQITSDITTAVAPHSTSAMRATSPQNPANPIEPPEDTTVCFTQQGTPLLRLRVFDELEKNKKPFEQYDPEVLGPALATMTVCRQLHQEAMVVLCRAYVDEKPFWCIDGSAGIPNFFARVRSFCQTMKRYAPHAHFSVSLTCHEWETALFSQQDAKHFVEELAHQCQQPADLSFELACRIAREDLLLCPAWKSGKFLCDGMCAVAKEGAHWKTTRSYFFVRGSVGAYRFTFTLLGGTKRHKTSYLTLEGCLAQLDWVALENA
ncbi:hypothetical protein MBLNU13_g11650t1 [Cladosporium sp. NU13]